MLGTIWQTVLVTPLLNLLVALYQGVGNLGIAIVLMTLIIRAVLLPVMLPSMKNMKKQKALKPELNKLQKKFKYDKKKLAEKQMALFKEHGINPASGCLTQAITILILFALYGVIRKVTILGNVDEINDLLYFAFLKFKDGGAVNTNFLYLDLAKPDPYFIFAILSGGLQFLASKMNMVFSNIGEKAAKETPEKSDDMAYNMQQQMLYTMPIMNVIVGVTLPSGIVLYMVSATLFSIVQSFILNGFEGLEPLINKVKKWTKK